MNSICHRLLIKAPIEKVYDALTTQQGLAGWWTPDTIASPQVDSIARFAFGPDYFKEMKIVNLQHPGLVQWQCIVGYPEWIGTTIKFTLTTSEKGTILLLHHDGWKAYTDEYAGCSYDWAIFLRSLKFLCETGKGFPYPNHYQ